MAPAPALTDYLGGRATPETGAVILGLSAAAAETAARLASFGNPAALEAEADAAFAAQLAALAVRFLASRPQSGISEIDHNGSLAVATHPDPVEADHLMATITSLRIDVLVGGDGI